MANREFFDREMRQRFEGFEPEPPAEVWLAIERGLAPSSPVPMFAPWLFRVAAAIAVLAVTGFSFFYFWADEHRYNSSLADRRLADDRSVAEESIAETGVPVQLETPTVADRIGISRPAATAVAVAQEARVYQTGDDTQHAALPLSEMKATGIVPGPLTGIAPMLASHAHPSIQGNVRSTGEFWPQADLLAFTPAESPDMFALGVFMAPQYNSRRITGGTGLAPGETPFTSLEQEALTYSYGLTGSVRLSKRLVVQTGATWLNVAQQVNQINALAHPDRLQFYDPAELPAYGHPQHIATSLGTINFDDPRLYFEDLGSDRVQTTKWPLDIPEPKLLEELGFGLTQRFSFVEIPVVLRYTLLDRRVGLHLKAGMAANFLINNEVLLVSDAYKDVVGQTSGLRDHYFSGIGGLVMTVPVSQRFQLFIEPTGQIFLNPMGRDDMSARSTKAFPYHFAVYSGLAYRF